MNKIFVLSVFGVIFLQAQLTIAIDCYNCSSARVNSEDYCKTDINSISIIKCIGPITECYTALGADEVQRGCGILNQESPFDVSYDETIIPLFEIQTCSTDRCNDEKLTMIPEPTVSEIACINCSTMNQPLCRRTPHIYNTNCTDIEDVKKAFCHKIEFKYLNRDEVQYGCGPFYKNATLIGVPNKFEAHIHRLKTCTKSMCNYSEQRVKSGGLSVIGIFYAFYRVFLFIN